METWTLLKLLLVFFILYLLGLYVYRMYFDPLSKIPGPKLAAATLWYEFYYDVYKEGRYTWKIWEMHNKYGKHAIKPLIAERKDDTFNSIQAPLSELAPMKYISMILR